MYLGDIEKGRILRGKFNTSAKATGAGITIGGTPSIAVYKDNSTTEITSGVVLTVDFDSRTGFHHWSVDTSGSDYTVGSDYSVVVTGGTVDGESINGKVLREFSLQNRFIRSEPDNANIGVAATQATAAASSAASAASSALSVDGKLTAGLLSRIGRLPDVIAGASGGLPLVGSAMTLDNATLTALFADADIAGLIASITALFDQSSDLPIQTIAAQAAASTVAALLANGSIATLLADAAAAKVAGQSADGKLTTLQIRVPAVVRSKTEDQASEDAILEAISAISAGQVSGPQVLTVSVIDSQTEGPIDGGVVRVYRYGESDESTDQSEDGEYQFGVRDEYAYTVVAWAPGYQSSISTVTIDGDTSHVVELVANVPEFADAPYCEIYVPVTNQFTDVNAAGEYFIDFISFTADAEPGSIVRNAESPVFADADGTIRKRGYRHANYQLRYKTKSGREERIVKFTIGNVGSFTLTEAN